MSSVIHYNSEGIKEKYLKLIFQEGRLTSYNYYHSFSVIRCMVFFEENQFFRLKLNIFAQKNLMTAILPELAVKTTQIKRH